MKQRLTMLFACLFLMLGGVLAQTKVSGTVTSQEDGQPVIGASILVVGTQVGTVTDANGKFTLTCPAGKNMLRITYVGMEPIEVSARPNMRIVLTGDQTALDEVIVVAYGTAKKSAFTGSAATVGAAEISKHTVANITDALAGSVSGLQVRGTSGAPGSNDSKINIRGIASMYAETDPLIIVDGAPYESSLSNIPPGDIESVSVLKDAASAALYGARGAAGVIIITTKKGKTQDATINVDMKWGVSSRSVPDYDVIKSPQQFYETYYSQLYNYYYYGQGNTAEKANQLANSTMLSHLQYNIYSTPQSGTDEKGNPVYENLIGLNGKLNPNATLGRTYVGEDGETYYMINDDWNDEAYRHAFRQEYTVNASGGNSRSSFYISANYLDEDGIIKPSSYKRFSTRVKADYQAKEWLKLGANLSYIRAKTESTSNLATSGNNMLGSTNVMYFTSNIAPIYPVYVRKVDADGNVYIDTDVNGFTHYDFGRSAGDYNGHTRPFLASGNPIGSNYLNKVEAIRNQYVGTFTIDVDICKGLKFNSTNTLNAISHQSSDYENPYFGPKAGVNGEITKSNTNNFYQNYTQTLSYNNQFGKHGVSAVLGHEWYKTTTKYLSAERTGGFSPEIPELNAFATMSGSNSYTTEYNVEGWFGNAQYNYDERYFASASYRRDATSRFAKNHRWGSFWSIGAAWLINKEQFFKNLNLKWIDLLKLKVSIGQQGNDNIGNWGYTELYTLTKASDTSMSPNFYRVGNENITWETTTNFNLGLEFALFKNRLTGSFDFYNKKTTDLLFWMSIPEAMGSRGYYGNLGDIRNRGFELVLSGDIIRTRNIQWNISANIAHNSTKILKLPETKTAENGGFAETGNNIQLWYAEGGELYTPFLREYAGVNEYGQALYWVDEDLFDESGAAITSRPGKKHSYTTTDYSKASRYAFKSLLPKFTGGFSTTLTAYGFDVTASFEYQIGGKVYDYHYQSLMGPVSGPTSVNGGNFHVDVLKSWTPNNTSSTIPRFQYADQYTNSSSNRWLTNAGYLSFQSFTVGYTLPKQLVSKVKLSNVRVYVAGENLALWSARKGLDPRYDFEGTSYVTTYSPARTINGGIQVSF